MLSPPPDFGVWLVAGAVSATTTGTSTLRTAATRRRIMHVLQSNWANGAQSVRENARSDNSREQPDQQMHTVEEAAGEPSHDGAVDPDELEVIPRVLLDQPHPALRPEGEHPLLPQPPHPAPLPPP